MFRLEYIALDTGNDEEQWVELGSARFCDPKDTSGKQALVDEPLVIPAIARHLSTDTNIGLSDYVLNVLGCAAERGAGLGEPLAVYLAHVFGALMRCL